MINEMQEAIRFLVKPDDVCEIRILYAARGGRKVCGFVTGRDFSKLASAIAHKSQQAWGVYFTPNPLSSECLARTRGSLLDISTSSGKPNPAPASDSDVAERRYLLIDVDPIRAEGHEGDSANEGERESAREVLDNCLNLLTGAGWADPIVVDSGNGFHAYYRLQQPIPRGETITPDPIQMALKLIATKCNTQRAEIDTKVFNPSRIMKLPGTIGRKGIPTADRPHRQSKIIEVPHGW
jgi:hypothetical protein